MSLAAYYPLGNINVAPIANVAANAAGNVLSAGGDAKKNIVMSVPSIVGGILTTGGTVATSAGGTTSIAAAAWGTAAIPIVGAAVAGVTVALMLYFNRKGPRQKVATTEIVNKIEPLMEDNLRGYMEGPRTPEAQAQALANFDAGWQYVLDGCGIPEMGEPGRRCISERQQGGSAPWCPTGTGCDWFTLYRDPIANDVPVAAPTVGGSIADQFSSIFGGGDGSDRESLLLPLLIGGGLIAAAVLL